MTWYFMVDIEDEMKDGGHTWLLSIALIGAWISVYTESIYILKEQGDSFKSGWNWFDMTGMASFFIFYGMRVSTAT